MADLERSIHPGLITGLYDATMCIGSTAFLKAAFHVSTLLGNSNQRQGLLTAAALAATGGVALEAKAGEVPLPTGQINPSAEFFGEGYTQVGATGDISRSDWYTVDNGGIMRKYSGLNPEPVDTIPTYAGLATSISFTPDGDFVIGESGILWYGHLDGSVWVNDDMIGLDTTGLQSLDLYKGDLIGKFDNVGLKKINADGSTEFIEYTTMGVFDYHEFQDGLYDWDLLQNNRSFFNINPDGSFAEYNRTVDLRPAYPCPGSAVFADGEGGFGMARVYYHGTWVYDDADLPFLADMKSSLMNCEDLIVDSDNIQLCGNLVYREVQIINNSSITVPEAVWNNDLQEWECGYLMLEANTIYIDSTSSISADGAGFSSDPRDPNDGGFGHGAPFIWDEFHGNYGGGEGAGHGGRGGFCQWTTPFGNGGEPYGSNTADPCNEQGYCDPTLVFGSAGGDYYRMIPDLAIAGGAGGGYIRLIATSSITIEGTISTDGADGQVTGDLGAPPGAGSGGGSGGYIILSSSTINLSGTLSAKGGDGSDPSEAISAGGGAGGRIIIANTTEPVCLSPSTVAGGYGGCYGVGNGEPGSRYFPSISSPPPVITGLVDDTGRYTDDLLTIDPTLAGIAEPESLIKLFVGGIFVGSGEADAGTGEFAVTITGVVEDGEVEVVATAQEPCANESDPSAPFTFTLDRVPPAIPSTPDLHPNSDTGLFDDDDVTHDWGPLFQGMSEPNTDIKLYEGTTELGTAYTADGNWQATSSSLSEGTHMISATALDAAGNESAVSGAISILVDVTDPVISNPLIAPTNCPHPSTIFDVQVTVTDALSGVQDASDPGAEIWLDESLVDWYSLDALGGNLFGGPWDSSDQVGGVYSVSFEAFDLAGNVQRLEDAATLCLAVAADLDEDGDVDLDDFSVFAGCMMGPGVSYLGGCEHADLEGDADVDLRDFATFQTAFQMP